MHAFCECNIVTSVWKQLKTYFDKALRLPAWTKQICILGTFDEASNNKIVNNHVILIFKLHVFK